MQNSSVGAFSLYGRGVYLLFLDESGQLSEGKFFALGGVALRASDWHALRGKVERAELGNRGAADEQRHENVLDELTQRSHGP